MPALKLPPSLLRADGTGGGAVKWRDCGDLLGLALRSPEYLVLYAVACWDHTIYVTKEFGPLAVREHAVRGTVLAVVEVREFSELPEWLPPEVRAVATEAVDALAYAVGLRDPYEVSEMIDVNAHIVEVEVSVPRWLLPPSIVRPTAAPGCPSCLYPRTRSGLAVLGTAKSYAVSADCGPFLLTSLARWRARRRLARSHPHLLGYLYTVDRGDMPRLRITIPCPTKELKELLARLAEAIGVLLQEEQEEERKGWL